MEDIRAIEKETQDLLKKKMANPDADADGEYTPGYDLEADLDVSSNNAKAQFCSIEYSDADVPNIIPKTSERVKRKSLGMFYLWYSFILALIKFTLCYSEKKLQLNIKIAKNIHCFIFNFKFHFCSAQLKLEQNL